MRIFRKEWSEGHRGACNVGKWDQIFKIPSARPTHLKSASARRAIMEDFARVVRPRGSDDGIRNRVKVLKDTAHAHLRRSGEMRRPDVYNRNTGVKHIFYCSGIDGVAAHEVGSEWPNLLSLRHPLEEMAMVRRHTKQIQC